MCLQYVPEEAASAIQLSMKIQSVLKGSRSPLSVIVLCSD